MVRGRRKNLIKDVLNCVKIYDVLDIEGIERNQSVERWKVDKITGKICQYWEHSYLRYFLFVQNFENICKSLDDDYCRTGVCSNQTFFKEGYCKPITKDNFGLSDINSIGISLNKYAVILYFVLQNLKSIEIYANEGVLRKCILLSPSVQHIDDELEKLVFVNGIKSIPALACRERTNLKEVSLPQSIKTIGEYAFYKCTSLKKVNIPKSVEIIGKSAFCDCESLQEVDIPKSVKIIGKSAFYNCTALKQVTLHKGLSSLKQMCFYNCSFKKINIPDTVVEISDGAFYNCNELEELNISKSVKNVGRDIVYSCDVLKNIHVSAESEFYSEIDGVLFSKDYKTILVYPYGRTEISYTIPTSCIVIGSYVFHGMLSLANVCLHNAVEKIEEKAFANCFNIENLVIPKSVRIIERYAFANCSKMIIYREIEQDCVDWHDEYYGVKQVFRGGYVDPQDFIK